MRAQLVRTIEIQSHRRARAALFNCSRERLFERVQFPVGRFFRSDSKDLAEEGLTASA